MEADQPSRRQAAGCHLVLGSPLAVKVKLHAASASLTGAALIQVTACSKHKCRCRADNTQAKDAHVRQLREDGRHSWPHAPLVAGGRVDKDEPALHRWAQNEAS